MRDHEKVKISMYKKAIEYIVSLEDEYTRDGSCQAEVEACKEIAEILVTKLEKIIVEKRTKKLKELILEKRS